jgi:hypothetical protein
MNDESPPARRDKSGIIAAVRDMAIAAGQRVTICSVKDGKPHSCTVLPIQRVKRD